jgi:hypothetical protein
LEQLGIAGGIRLGVFVLRRVARQVGLGLPQRGLILRQVGNGLVQCGRERPLIDGEQQVAGLDVISLVEGDGGQLAAHLRLH